MVSTSACVKITVAGQLSDPKYHRAAAIAKSLEAKCPSQVAVTIVEYFECQWRQYLKKIQNTKKGDFYDHRGSPLVFLGEGDYVGGVEEFAKWALTNYHHQDGGKMADYEQKAIDVMRQRINCTKGRRYIEVHFQIGNDDCPAVVLELFEDLAPQTVQNFLTLAKAVYETKQDDKAPSASFKDSEIHRIVPGMFI